MRIAERLGRKPNAPTKKARAQSQAETGQPFVADSGDDMANIAQALHAQILDRLDLAQVAEGVVAGEDYEQLRANGG